MLGLPEGSCDGRANSLQAAIWLDIEHLEFNDTLVVTLRRSKTDPEGQGRPVGIPYGSTAPTCPFRAVKTG